MNITVIGTGYVGLVTGACFSKKGNQVYCVDIDEEKIEGLKRGVIPIFEPDLERIVIESQKSGDLIFTTNLKEAVDDSNIIFIAVGTPMNDDGSANLDHVLEAARNIGRTISHESLVVVKSTVPVGTSHEIQRIINEISEIEVDIASNPEFLREGRAVEDFMNPDRIVIGAENDKVFETLKELYQPFTSNHEQFILMDVESSELTKYVANALLATRISFMNEIANICEVTGTNIQDIQRGIGSDMRIGHDYLNAGCGYGGSCLPKDVNALINMANSNGYDPAILTQVEEVNSNQKNVLVNKIVDRFGDDLNGLTFGIWGLAFKPGTSDVRKATSLVVISKLIEKGAKIRAYDPRATAEFEKAIDEKYLQSIEFVDEKYSALKDCESMILITEWKEFENPDFNLLSDKLNLNIIFDGRNIYDKKINSMGFELYQIGC